jgi:hypothetical protein
VLAKIFQLKMFMAMRPALAALLMLVLALTGTGDFEPLARDTWKSQNTLETLWATTNSRYVVTTKMMRRHCRPNVELAPWSPQVLGRPPTMAEVSTPAFMPAGPDWGHAAPHPLPLWLMAPSPAARLVVAQDVTPGPVVYHDLRAPPLAA